MNSESVKPVGKLFTHVYLDRGTPTSDNEVFRRRLAGYCIANFQDYHLQPSEYIKQETGLTVPLKSGHRDWEGFFLENHIHNVLNLITIIWRFFKKKSNDPNLQQKCFLEMAKWHNFVEHVLREENLGYLLDTECGVHFLVDEEFLHNRASVLSCLDTSRYAGVRAAFESAHSYLDANPPDTKASVRSMFEALEILARLMVDTRNLNQSFVNTKLTPLVTNIYNHDPIAVKTITGLFKGFGEWVDAVHNYRHGQGVPEPVDPPLDLAVYILSSGASFLRWLIEIDKKTIAVSATAVR